MGHFGILETCEISASVVHPQLIPTCKNINLNFGLFSKLMLMCNILDDISCCQVKVKVDQEVFKLSLSLKSRDAKMNNDG